MGVTFINPVLLSDTTLISWVDVDVSSYVGIGVTGIILHCINTHESTNYSFGVRKNGSSDSMTDNMQFNWHTWICIGVDNYSVFEMYKGNNAINVYLIGYFDSDAVFLTNAVNKTLSTTNTWTDVDISDICGTDNPIGVFVKYNYVSTVGSVGLRKNGSTDNRINGVSYLGSTALVGIDESKLFEGYVATTSIKFYVVGYLKSGAVINTNAINVSLSTINSYLNLPILENSAKGGIYEVISNSTHTFALRKYGASDDLNYKIARHIWTYVECDENKLIEGKISNTGVDFFNIGYFTQTISTTPTITIQSYTKSKISAQTTQDISTVTFQSDQNLLQWEARADGNGQGSGLLVGSGGAVTANTDVTFDIENEELTFGDKIYRINIYGQNESGVWSNYG